MKLGNVAGSVGKGLFAWAIGTAASSLSGLAATMAHFAAVWGSEIQRYPVLGVTPPITEWGAQEIAVDTLHHLVYALETRIAH